MYLPNLDGMDTPQDRGVLDYIVQVSRKSKDAIDYPYMKL